MRPVLPACVTLLLIGCASTPPEEDPVQVKLNELEARVERLERSLANQVTLSQHVDENQASLRELQGRIEELEHNNEALAKQQRDLYADLDKRLGGNGTVPAPGAARGCRCGRRRRGGRRSHRRGSCGGRRAPRRTMGPHRRSRRSTRRPSMR